jgi:pimeloyl-ACP methyl ester carboxylesterase
LLTLNSLHTGTESAKKIIKAFYGRKPAHSYYIGCSLGGRMGIKAAEEFPNDYDGIVAGAPAVDFCHLQGQRAMFYPITGPVGSPDFINADTWRGLIHNEVLAQCDELDGVRDGIIEVPSRCFFDPSRLLCSPGQTSDCLSAVQVEQVQKIYAPYTYDDGTLIFPRMNPGNEEQVVARLLAGAPFEYSQDWFRYVVLNDTTWDAINYNRDHVHQAEAQNPFNIRTFPQELPRFKKRGGKIISYHGGQDQQITSFNTDRFWDRMAEADPNLHDYFRYFRVSGLFHCSSGPGAWVLGQGGGASARGIPFDAKQNVLTALVAWVEDGRVPESIRGTKFIADDVTKGIDFQRDHCLYPRNQTYMGGDHRNVSSWACV